MAMRSTLVRVKPSRDARSLGIATALRKPTSPVVQPHDPHRNHFLTVRLKEQVMFRKTYAASRRIVIATALVVGTSGVALADDSSMNPFTGDFYRELQADRNLGDSSLARTTWAPAKNAAAECSNAESRRATRTERFLALTPTPIFSDKGA